MSRSPDKHWITVGTALLATLAGCAHPPTWPRVGEAATELEDPDPSGPRYLRDYKESHYRSLGSDFVATHDWDSFARRLDDVDVLFLGDHHFDAQLHARILATIDRLTQEGRSIAVGVEAIGIQDEAALSLYMNGDRDLGALRRAVQRRWPDSWLDHKSVDADFYRRLLATARRGDARVFALEPTPRLALDERDAFIGKRIRAVRGLMPDRLLVVVVGHAHLFGQGRLAERTGLRSLAVCARLSKSLLSKVSTLSPVATRSPQATDDAPRFVESDTGVLFFDPKTAAPTP